MVAQPTIASLPHPPSQVVLTKIKNTWLAVFLLKKNETANFFISSLGKGILLKGKPQSETTMILSSVMKQVYMGTATQFQRSRNHPWSMEPNQRTRGERLRRSVRLE